MDSNYRLNFAIIGILTLLFSACGTAPDEIQKSLQITKVSKFKYEEVSDKIRFNDTFAAPNNSAADEKIAFEFQLPVGWVEIAKAQFKDLNIAFKSEPKAFCYLTVLPIQGGEILPNLNRWRGQFSLPPLTDDAEQESEIVKFLNEDTKLFRLTGDFKPLDAAGKNYTSLSLLLSDQSNAYTFKFLGPADFIAKEKNNCITFLNSVKIKNQKTTTPKDAVHDLPLIPNELLWETPKGWVITTPKPQRIATFKPIDKNAPECYITAFGGGMLDNINRWRTQMKLPAIENIAEQKLENFISPLGNGVVIFLEGSFSGGMTGLPIENATMAGAIILGSNKSVFIKMVGTKEEISQEKELFLQLIKSIKGVPDAK